jgi:hypothetical protein
VAEIGNGQKRCVGALQLGLSIPGAQYNTTAAGDIESKPVLDTMLPRLPTALILLGQLSITEHKFPVGPSFAYQWPSGRDYHYQAVAVVHPQPVGPLSPEVQPDIDVSCEGQDMFRTSTDHPLMSPRAQLYLQ